MTWEKKPQARDELLSAVVALGPTRATAGEVARRLSKSPATVLQMLYALKADDVVAYERVKSVMHWRATGRPIPAASTSTCKWLGDAAQSGYDHRPLAAALCMPSVPPAAPSEPSIVHYLGGAYAHQS